MPVLDSSALELVAQSLRGVTTLSVAAARAQHSAGVSLFVDLREQDERRRHGLIPGALHVPRGELEFYFDAANPLHLPALGQGKSFVLFCAGGWRSALAADALSHLGVRDVAHIGGGFSAWLAAGGPVTTSAPDAESRRASTLAWLARASGAWRGEHTLHLPGEPDDAGPSELAIDLPASGVGRIIQLWSRFGAAQRGEMLIASDSLSGEPGATWFDTWHQSNGLMHFETAAKGEALDLRGAFSAPETPPWGWRVNFELADERRLHLTMWCKPAASGEAIAVEARYARVT